jgi:hypothetical protein
MSSLLHPRLDTAALDLTYGPYGQTGYVNAQPDCSSGVISAPHNLWSGGREFMYAVIPFIKSLESLRPASAEAQKSLWTYNIDDAHSLFTPSCIYMYYLTQGR